MHRLKNGIEIKTTERITVSTQEGTQCLNIKETRQEDQGVYSIVATNKEGETKGDIKLHVHSKTKYSFHLLNSLFSQSKRRITVHIRLSSLMRRRI